MVGPSAGMKAQMMPEIFDYVIKNYYPEIFKNSGGKINHIHYMQLFEEVVNRTAKMVAQW